MSPCLACHHHNYTAGNCTGCFLWLSLTNCLFLDERWMNVCLTFCKRYHKIPQSHPISLITSHENYCRTRAFFVILLHQTLMPMTHLKNTPIAIVSDRKYSVKEACLFLGIHRCTIYDYIHHPDRPLPFIRIHTDKRGILFRGSDLIAYKEAGLPRRGRKFKDSPRE